MRTRAPWLLVAAGAALSVPLLWFSVLNDSFTEDVAFIPLALITMAGWATVGALLASRNPTNPIGWLMIAFGLGFLFIGLGSEWSTYALVTEPGGVPLGAFWAWIPGWFPVAFAVSIPVLLVLYPTGRPMTPRWRLLIWGIVAGAALGGVASALNPSPLVVDDIEVANPFGVPALEDAIDVAQTVAGIAFIAVLIPLCILALILRFRRASGEERQQIRWLAFTSAIGALAFVVAVVASLELEEHETSVVSEVAFYVFFVAVGLGVPAAIGVALLKYRLWDLDVVVKKALVAAVVVGSIIAVSIVVLLGLGAILVGPIADQPGLVLVVGLLVGALVWPLLRVARRVADRIVYGSRATPYEVLTEFSDRMAESYATDDVLPRMAAILGQGTGAERVDVWLHVGGGLRPATTWPPAERREEESEVLPLFALARPDTFEVRHQGEILGAIGVVMPANDPMNPSKERLIRDLASQAGLVLRNVRLIEDLRESRRRIVVAVDEGRRRLERNIHDGAQQQLVALAVKLRLAEGAVARDPDQARELLRQLGADVTGALENLRDLARGIYPPLLSDEGLGAALTAQARKSPVPVHLEFDGIGRYRQDVEGSVYFCVLEALQNVAKYAQASRVDLELREEPERLAFSVRDDGVGFDRATAPRGSGVQGMVDRIEAVGGTIEIASAPGRGTRVEGSIPV